MIEVISPGAASSLQDLGRFGWQAAGIGTCGTMDTWAARVANLLLDNAPGATVLEMCASGPRLRFREPAWIALCGADMGARIDSVPLAPCRPVRADRGSVLVCGAARRGLRAYLAVRGGFAAECWLGSTSTDVRAGRGGHLGRWLRRGDVLEHAARSVQPPAVRVAWSGALALPPSGDVVTLPLVAAPAFSQLDGAQRDALFGREFEVGRDADRMGLRLEPALPSADRLPAILSRAVAFGALQLPPDGKPIILGADRQTTGGYPLLGVVASVAHSDLAQLRSGARLRFAGIGAREAHEAWRAREQRFERLGVAVRAWWRGQA